MATIGETLRLERQRKGLKVKDAEAALHIRSTYLEALEEDDYELIPGDVYVKGFIRNYATFLGLDGKQMVDHYKIQRGERVLVPVKPTAAVKKSNSVAEEAAIHERLTYEGRAERRKKRIVQEQFMLGGFLALVLIFLIWLFI